ncbi:WD40 repeat domain-containing protein [Thermodesulfobacteriota bacterium]
MKEKATGVFSVAGIAVCLLAMAVGTSHAAEDLLGVTGFDLAARSHRIVLEEVDGHVSLWDISSDDSSDMVWREAGSGGPVAISSDGSLIASVGSDNAIDIRDARERTDIWRIKGPGTRARGIAFPPGDNLLVLTESDELISVWMIKDGGKVCSFSTEKHEGGFKFSADGDSLLIAADRRILSYNLRSGEKKVLYEGTRRIGAFDGSPDGKSLAVGVDNDVILVDLASGETVRALKGHLLAVSALSFSFYGNRLASGSVDKTIRIWDLNASSPGRVLFGHYLTVSELFFAWGGGRVVSRGADQTVRIWDLELFKLQSVLGEPLSLAGPRWNVEIKTFRIQKEYKESKFPYRSWSCMDGFHFGMIDVKVTNTLPVDNGFFSSNLFLRDSEGKRYVCVGEESSDVLDSIDQTQEYLKFNVHSGTAVLYRFIFIIPDESRGLKFHFQSLPGKPLTVTEDDEPA